MWRSTPGKLENGAAVSTVATLARHKKSSLLAPAGRAAISRVLPRPFFHGLAVQSCK